MKPAASKQQTAADRALVVGGLDVIQRDPYQITALMRVLHATLQTCIEKRSISQLMHFVYQNLKATVSTLSDIPVACARGCSHCCNMWVDATAPEILYIVKTTAGPSFRKLAGSICDAHERTKAMDFDARAIVPIACPMLSDMQCGIYTQRPISCRTAVSMDADLCRRVYLEASEEEMGIPLLFNATASGYRVALAGAIKHAQLPYFSYELNSALVSAMSVTNAEQLWLSGQDIFASAIVPPESDIFSVQMYRELYEAAFN